MGHGGGLPKDTWAIVYFHGLPGFNRALAEAERGHLWLRNRELLFEACDSHSRLRRQGLAQSSTWALAQRRRWGSSAPSTSCGISTCSATS